MELPAGFVRLRRNGWRIAVREDLLGAGGGTFPDPLELEARGTHTFRGRGRPVRVPLPDESFGVLRRYLHGGLLRAITGPLFAGAPRPLRELRALERARAGGVQVPEGLAAFVRPRAGLLHEGWILTREVPGARDLVEVLPEGTGAGAVLEAAGREARRMHDAGVRHADLHVKNVLVAGDGVWLLDFDRARVLDPLPDADRRRNLLRFDRSVVKMERSGVRVPLKTRLRFFRGYYGGRPAAGERELLVTACRKSLSRHRAWWAIARVGRRS
jgi:tRNA A-37 threonylcarbamoyl transferase component Bud32